MKKIDFHISSLKNIDWTGYSRELENLVKYNGNDLKQNEINIDLTKICRGKNLLFVNSGTAALELALMTLKLTDNDEVIVPSYTFSSCANAIIRTSAKPVFCDIELENLHASINTIVPLITKKTKCIMIVEYAGVRSNIKEIRKLCDKKGIVLILDSAQSFGAFDIDYDFSNYADFVCYSFHDTKTFSCGEGGLLVVNNEKFKNDAQIMFEKGTNRYQFLEGKVEKYNWCEIGSSFVLSNVNLLLLKYQLKIFDEVILQKFNAIKVYDNFFYDNNLWYVKKYAVHSKGSNGHIFWILLKNNEIRNQLKKFLYHFKIESTTHYVPLHSTKFAIDSGFRHSDNMTNTNFVNECLLRLPVISYETSNHIIRIISKFRPSVNA